MIRLRNHLIGIDQGETAMFSDFEDGGAMWTGNGPRESRQSITFSEAFRSEPSVQASISLWDIDTENLIRAEVSATEITNVGFDLVFRTWGDTRVARIRAAWMAIGELPHSDEWDMY
ncbi:MAG: H-type lectin domain-containing protein [Paracoccaceae bacterium]